MLDIWKGVDSLIDAYAKVRPNDIVVVIFTPDALESAAWVSAGLELRNIKHRRLPMSPLRDEGFEERLSNILPTVAELPGRLIIMSFEQDTMSHTTALLKEMQKYPREKIVAIRAISAGPELFSVGLLPAPEELERRNAYLLERIYGAKHLRITTPSGSDFEVNLASNKHRWISNRGCLRPGGTMVLPAGEVATYPASVDGIFIADFAYNVNTITKDDVRLAHAPVELKIIDGTVVNYFSADEKVMSFLRLALQSDCSKRIGELGFGTNFSVSSATPMNSHVNERCPGVHLGLGQHNQDSSVVGYQCVIHLDLIAQGGLVWADGVFAVDLADIPPSDTKHPDFTSDQDVFSPAETDDCCGTTQCDLSLG